MSRMIRLLLSMNIILAVILITTASAQNPNPQEIDLACAIVSSAEIATTKPDTDEGQAALLMFSFYLGRLTIRDTRTDWAAVVKGRIAEMHEKTKSQIIYSGCLKFFTSKFD